MDMDIALPDQEFADVVLAWLRENKRKARTFLLPPDDNATVITLRDTRYKRRHESPAQLAMISKAEAKRLRKMARHEHR